MLINIKSVHRQDTIDVEASDTIKNVKERLADRWGFTWNRLRLVYNGRNLEIQRTLADYNVQSGAEVHAIWQQLRGGERLLCVHVKWQDGQSETLGFGSANFFIGDYAEDSRPERPSSNLLDLKHLVASVITLPIAEQLVFCVEGGIETRLQEQEYLPETCFTGDAEVLVRQAASKVVTVSGSAASDNQLLFVRNSIGGGELARMNFNSDTATAGDLIREIAAARFANDSVLKVVVCPSGSLLGEFEISTPLSNFVEGTMHANWERSSKARVVALFKKFDVGAKGVISRKDFSDVMVSLTPSMSLQDLSELFEAYDGNQGGALDYCEFANFVFKAVQTLN